MRRINLCKDILLVKFVVSWRSVLTVISGLKQNYFQECRDFYYVKLSQPSTNSISRYD